MKRLLFVLLTTFCSLSMIANPVDELLERIDKGASAKFKTQLVKSDKDFFELDQQGNKVVVRGNTWVNIASGVNWYLKYYAGIHLSWNQMQAKLPAVLPAVTQKERRETDLIQRYAFNYCTFSYSMAFWDWARWEKEIDWLALHGVNLPLAIVGEECVWRNMLLKLGYTEEEVGKFIAGPAFLADEQPRRVGWSAASLLVRPSGEVAETDPRPYEATGHAPRVAWLLWYGATRCEREAEPERGRCRTLERFPASCQPPAHRPPFCGNRHLIL